MVKESGAHSTQLTTEETVDEFADKMKQYAIKWGKLADDIWYSKKHKNSS